MNECQNRLPGKNLASHAGVFREARFSSLKSSWEARKNLACVLRLLVFRLSGNKHVKWDHRSVFYCCKAGCGCICSLPSFSPGIFWVLLEVLRIVFGIDFCPHSIIPVTWKQEYPCSDATIIDTMCAIKVGTIYIPMHQVPTAAVKDTADLLIEHRKLTLPLRIWKIVSKLNHLIMQF